MNPTDTRENDTEGRQEARSAPTLDLPAIRAAAMEGLPVMAWVVLALLDRIEALEQALRPYAEQEYSDTDNLLAARELLGMSDFPPLTETFAELRDLVGPHFDGVDSIAFVAELRGDAAESRD